jgi:hypothetical protein
VVVEAPVGTVVGYVTQEYYQNKIKHPITLFFFVFVDVVVGVCITILKMQMEMLS